MCGLALAIGWGWGLLTSCTLALVELLPLAVVGVGGQMGALGAGVPVCICGGGVLVLVCLRGLVGIGYLGRAGVQTFCN